MKHLDSLQPYTTPVTPKAVFVRVDDACNDDGSVVESVKVSGDIAPDYMDYLRCVRQTRRVLERLQFKTASLDCRTAMYGHPLMMVPARIFNHAIKSRRDYACLTIQANQCRAAERPAFNESGKHLDQRQIAQSSGKSRPDPAIAPGYSIRSWRARRHW